MGSSFCRLGSCLGSSTVRICSFLFFPTHSSCSPTDLPPWSSFCLPLNTNKLLAIMNYASWNSARMFFYYLAKQKQTLWLFSTETRNTCWQEATTSTSTSSPCL
jgi:hypothetical protein